MDGKVGSETDYEIKVEEGKIMLKLNYDGKGVDAGVWVALEGEYFIDKLTDAIPGSVDDMIGAALKGALK